MKPASAAFAEAITSSHDLAVLVEVLTDDVVVGSVEHVVEGNVTLAASAQTRGRADITVVDDGTLGLIPQAPTDLFAPYGNELRLSRGITYPDGSTELMSLGVFRINEVTPADTASGTTIQIACMDRSARIIDARFEEPYQVASGTNYTTAIQSVLEAAWPEIPTSFTATSRTTPQLIAEEGGDRWAFAVEMATAIGMILYFDGDGTCVLRPSATNVSPVATLAEGEGEVLLDASKSWSRQGAFNRVIATGENTGETAPARGVATDDNPLSPTYYYGPFGKVPRFYVSPFITTDAQAADAAAAILARELGTTQKVSFGTIVDPRLEPDDVVQITRARTGMDEQHVIDQISIPLTAQGAISGSTRATMVTS